MTYNDMEIGLETTSIHSNGFFDFSLTIDLKILGQNMDNFLSRKHDQLMNLVTQSINVVVVNHFVTVGTGNVIAVLQTANMLAGNAHNNITDGHPRTAFCILNSLLNRLNGLGNVIDHTAMDAQAFGLTNAQNFHFTKFIFATDHGHNLCGSNIQTYGYVLVSHNFIRLPPPGC